MTEMDYEKFSAAFGRVCNAFRVKLKPTEAEDLTRTYFRVLEAHLLDDVLLAGKACLGKLRTFPRAADWLAELSTTAAPTCPVDRRHMTVAEIDAHARAALMRYEDEPCGCVDCEDAGVMHRPLRFVPTLVDLYGDEEERAFNPRRGQTEVVGHWAHGEELRRWYVAREAFYALAKKNPYMPRAPLQLVAAGEREPGMEG